MRKTVLIFKTGHTLSLCLPWLTDSTMMHKVRLVLIVDIF